MIHLRTLGDFGVLVDGRELHDIAGQPIRAALLLLVAMERETSRANVVATLWPNASEDRGRHALRQTLYQLRHDLGDGWIHAGPEKLCASKQLTADALEFAACVEGGSLDRALEAYVAPFLSGAQLADGQPFELWCDQWRARLARLYRRACRSLIEKHGASGATTEALCVADRWISVEPFEDEAHHRALELLLRLGREDDALQHYDRYARQLAAEDLKPLDETRQLVEGIRRAARRPILSPLPPPDRRRGRTGKGPPRWRPLAVPIGILIAIAASVALVALYPGRGAPVLSADRVLVLPFANETGDSTFDGLGPMAADWLIQGLASTAELKPVPFMDALRAAGADESPQASARARGAGTVVSGRIYRRGESLEFRVEITDANRGELWFTPGPIRVPADSALNAIAELRQRVMGSLAVRFTPGAALARPGVQHPPRYDAFRAYMGGSARFLRSDFAAAIPLLDRAYALDTTFVRAKLAAASAYSNLGLPARADSVLRFVAKRRAQLAPYEEVTLDYGEAQLRGDWGMRLDAVRRAARIDPGGTLHYLSAGTALEAGRPREALALTERLDPQCPWAPDLMRPWLDVTAAYHVLRQYEHELELAHRARRLHPDRLTGVEIEARALIGLGRLQEALTVLRQAPPRGAERRLDAGEVLLNAAEELRAHDYRRQADELAAAAIAWHRTRAAVERPAHRADLAEALIFSSRYPEADSVLRGTPASDTAGLRVLGLKGIVAAALGDTTRANVIDRRFAGIRRPYLSGEPTYWRAAIAARSGRTHDAIALLRLAFAQGWPRGIRVHVDPHLERLRPLPAFTRLVSDER